MTLPPGGFAAGSSSRTFSVSRTFIVCCVVNSLEKTSIPFACVEKFVIVRPPLHLHSHPTGLVLQPSQASIYVLVHIPVTMINDHTSRCCLLWCCSARAHWLLRKVPWSRAHTLGSAIYSPSWFIRDIGFFLTTLRKKKFSSSNSSLDALMGRNWPLRVKRSDIN